MTQYVTLLVALAYASLGGVLVGLGLLLRYRERVDLLDMPWGRRATDKLALARFVGLWTLVLGAVTFGLGAALVGEHAALLESLVGFAVVAAAYAAGVYYVNLANSTTITAID